MADDNQRHSHAASPELISDPDERAEREALNGLRQFDAAREMINHWLEPDRPFRLRLSTILQLHRVALEGISSFAGNFRPANVEIVGSKHVPGGAHLVPAQLEDLCDYVNDNWEEASALHLAAYVMWKLNWIHPFDDGNGRTARVVSYVILCVKLNMQLPGVNSIPEQIAGNKKPYYDALEQSDEAFKTGKVDVSSLENLLSSLLANQLYSVHRVANKDLDNEGDETQHVFH